MVFQAKIVPGASRTAICGRLGPMVKLKVAAPPERGKANQCLIGFLAKQLGVKKNAVQIISGEASPVKQVYVAGLLPQTVSERLRLEELRL